MSLTDENKKWLKDLTRTSVDDARVTIDCREVNGRFMTVEECEFCLSMITPASKTLWKLFESKARKAFRGSLVCRGEKACEQSAREIGSGDYPLRKDFLLGQSNYTTLRKALYLATDEAICERIRREIQTRFPWGSWK